MATVIYAVIIQIVVLAIITVEIAILEIEDLIKRNTTSAVKKVISPETILERNIYKIEINNVFIKTILSKTR